MTAAGSASGPERWALVKSAFHAAVECDPGERERVLAGACGGDAGLRREVEELLRKDEEAGRAQELHSPLLSPLAEEAFAPMPAGVGPYRLLREIGRGGMGSVYLAERADQTFRKRVAVKLLRRALFSPELLRRFRHERQILADLEHPAIARLIDGGTTQGDPYIVMEYVEGLPIDEYCRRNGVDTRARLELFRKVCAAVQYAHQRLVVHRDLKPANILVAADGEPKLLDFGIAKLLEPETDPDERRTATDLRAMTPEYASPEQVSGGSISTGSDVYSLGVILYELLAGTLPYRLESRSAHAVSLAVLGQEPPRPSEAFRCACDGGPCPRAPRQLRGDLDNIVLMALRKDPARRYPSVERLDGDVARYLRGLPVSARRETVGYRFGKLVMRQKLGTAAVLLLAASIAGGVAATLHEAHIARRRAEDVRKLAGSLIFEFHDAIQGLPGATTVREKLLTRAVEYLDALARDAGSDRALLRELATAYERVGDLQGRPGIASLGKYDAALGSFDRSLAIREKLWRDKPSDDGLARELASSTMRRAHLHGDRGRLQEAIRDFDAAIALLEPVTLRHTDDVDAARDLGTAWMLLGDVLGSPHRPSLVDPARALAAYEKSEAILGRLSARDPKSGERRHFHASSLIRLATVKGVLGKTREAEADSAAARSILEKLRAEYPSVVAIQGDLALLTVLDAERVGKRDPKRALALLPDALATFDRLAASDMANASAMEDLAWAEMNEGELASPVDLALAQRALERSLALFRSLLSSSPERARLVYATARTRTGLAKLLLHTDPARARREDEAARALLVTSRERGNRDRRVPTLLFEIEERLAPR